MRDKTVSLTPWYRRAGAWIGIGTGPAALMTGAAMTAVAGPSVAAPALVAGAVIVYLVCVWHGVQALDSRTAMASRMQSTFGRGSWLPIVTVVVGMVGWSGFYVGVGGAALTSLLDTEQVVGAAVLGTAMLGLVLLGKEWWNFLVYLTAGSAVALTIVTVVLAPHGPAEGSSPGVVEGTLIAVGGVIASTIVFAMRVPDFTTDLRGRRDVWLAGLTLFIPLVVMSLLGAWLFARTGLYNLADLLGATNVPPAGLLFLVFSTVAPTVTAIFSSAVSLESLASIKPRVTLVAASVVTVALGAARFDLRLIGFLEGLGVLMPQALTVMLLTPMLGPVPGPHPLLAWLAGSGVAFALRGSGFSGLLGGCAVTGLWLLSARHLVR